VIKSLHLYELTCYKCKLSVIVQLKNHASLPAGWGRKIISGNLGKHDAWFKYEHYCPNCYAQEILS
jgi:hypothetical protein